MTAYEKELLALAVVWCRERGKDLCISHVPGECWHEDENGIAGFGEGGQPDADALTALLRDLGVEVPERPSAANLSYLRMRLREAVAEEASGETPGAIHAVETLLRGFDRPTVLALLEGGES